MVDFFIDNFLMIVLLSNNLKIEKSKSKRVKLLLLEVALISVFNFLELYFATFDTFQYARLVFSFLCYSLRPVIIITFISILSNNKIVKYFSYLSILNAIIYSTCFFTDIAFSFHSDNTFYRGPLGYSTHALCIIYLFLLIYLIVKKHYKQSWNKTIMLLYITFINTIAAFFDFAFGTTLFDQTILVCALVYYLILYMEYNKIDALTKTFNRMAFYDDIDKYKCSITSVISIDMNDLKKINDNLGHLEGDKALVTLSSIFLNSEKNNARVYRVGGDEFVILCFDLKESDVKKVISKIKDDISKTRYTCSLGYEMRKSNDDIIATYKIADEKMYKEKEEHHLKYKDVR